MSAFLGPIHYALFTKIRFQDDFCKFLIKKVEEKDIKLKENILENTYSIPDEDLADIIDQGNIHGSLQTMISKIEYKLVYIVDLIDKNKLYTFEEIVKIAENFGKTVDIQENMELVEAYKFINSKILNGMPCDRVQEILSNEPDSILWLERVDIHKMYWEEFGRDSREFYILRSAIIESIFENTNVKFIELEELKYELRRR